MTDFAAINPAASAIVLEAGLRALQDSGAQHLDPVRFHIIATMAIKASGLSDAAAEHLRQRAAGKLLTYQADQQRAQQHAGLQLEKITDQYPEHSEAAAELLAAGRFKALARLLEDLERAAQHQPMQQLCRLLAAAETDSNDDKPAPSPGEYLRQQELDLTRDALPSSNANFIHPPTPLKSAQLCRDALTQLEAEYLVTQATRTAPEDSGPLNPHKLAIRSLLGLREISPSYLGRLVSYLDTLAWLENN